MEKEYSQFKAMLAIAKASLQSILRSPSAVVFTLLFPLTFVVVFGFINAGEMKLRVGVDLRSHLDNQIFDEIGRQETIRLIPGLDTAVQQKMLNKGDLDAILQIRRINTDSTPAYTLTLTTSTALPDQGRIVHTLLEQVVDKINLRAAGISRPMAEIRQQVLKGRPYRTIDFILPGQLGFSLLSTGVFGTAFVFFNLRQTLVIKRFFATPVEKPYIILGEALSRLVFSLSGAAILILIGNQVMGFTLVNGMTTFLGMLGISALGLIVFMGFGFIVSGIARSESTIPPLANIITLPQFILSGTFFGTEVFPEWLQSICRHLPLTHLNHAMRMIAFDGAGWEQLWSPLSAILGWGLFIYGLAIRVFRWE